jgi:hypothetical protein
VEARFHALLVGGCRRSGQANPRLRGAAKVFAASDMRARGRREAQGCKDVSISFVSALDPTRRSVVEEGKLLESIIAEDLGDGCGICPIQTSAGLSLCHSG